MTSSGRGIQYIWVKLPILSLCPVDALVQCLTVWGGTPGPLNQSLTRASFSLAIRKPFKSYAWTTVERVMHEPQWKELCMNHSGKCYVCIGIYYKCRHGTSTFPTKFTKHIQFIYRQGSGLCLGRKSCAQQAFLWPDTPKLEQPKYSPSQ